MAEAIALIGTAGALANIIDVLGKTVIAVAEFRQQWHDADLTIVTLESQLCALKTALARVKTWASSLDESELICEQELAGDLHRCIDCCHTLVNKIDAELVKFELTSENVMDRISKFRLLAKTKEFENILRVLDQQTNVLTLLILAFNIEINPDETEVLPSPLQRSIQKNQDERISLLAHRDVDSILAPSTSPSINSSKRSLMFDFDADLFVTRIYRRVMRGSVKRILHEQQDDTPYETRLRRSKWRPAFVVLGAESRFDVVERLKSELALPYSGGERHRDRKRIIKEVSKCAKQLTSILRAVVSSPQHDADFWNHVDFLESYSSAGAIHRRTGMGSSFVEAVNYIRNTPCWEPVLRDGTADYLPDFVTYFFTQIDRIGTPTYVPTMDDFMALHRHTPNMYNFNLTAIKSEGVCGALLNEPIEHQIWFQEHDYVKLFILVADLDTYDDILGARVKGGLWETLRTFQRIANSPFAGQYSVILLLNKYSTFRDKLTARPLGDFFPEYNAGKGCAASFIRRQFEAHCPDHDLELFPFIIDTDAQCCKISEIISGAVQDIFDNIRENLSHEEVVAELLAEAGFPDYDTMTSMGKASQNTMAKKREVLVRRL